MRNVLKAETLERKFPLLSVENGCIVSKDADLTVAFDNYEREALKLVEKNLILPGYDYCLKCSHTFNLLDARKAISVAERTRYIGRIRNIARQVAQHYVEQRAAMGHPLLKETV